MTYILVAATFLFLTAVNIVVPMPGSSVVTPLLSIFVDPHAAIGLAAFYFFLSGIVRVAAFWEYVRWNEVRKLIVPSMIAAFIGASALIVVPEVVLFAIVFVMAIGFLMRRIKPASKKEGKRMNPLIEHFVGFISGFLQGVGLSGSDVRSSYLYAKNLSISEVHGTTPFLGAANFFVATVARLYTEQLALPDLAPLLFVFPFIVIGTFFGKKILLKVPQKTANLIIIGIMTVTVILLGIKLTRMF